jgi:hypothetical protein
VGRLLNHASRSIAPEAAIRVTRPATPPLLRVPIDPQRSLFDGDVADPDLFHSGPDL